MSRSPEELARSFRLSGERSELILAQHAQRHLGMAFHGALQEEIYRESKPTSPLIEAIGEMASKRRVASVVTYNFDDFLETELRRRRIRHRTIWRPDGTRSRSPLPVYHVHGLVRRTGSYAKSSVVFAETEFQEESLDAYRWSALVQLASLSRITCLFLGVSVQDPNLRRFLAVSRSRSPESPQQHFTVKKRVTAADVLNVEPTLGIDEAIEAAELVRTMLETDLNALGLQVMWVDRYEDFPPFVAELARA